MMNIVVTMTTMTILMTYYATKNYPIQRTSRDANLVMVIYYNPRHRVVPHWASTRLLLKIPITTQIHVQKHKINVGIQYENPIYRATKDVPNHGDPGGLLTPIQVYLLHSPFDARRKKWRSNTFSPAFKRSFQLLQ